MSVRVYVAAGPEGISALCEDGQIEAPTYGVTDAMRAAAPDTDEEDLEYEACLLAEDRLRREGRGVVVVAADVTGRPVAGDEPGRLVVGVVPLRSVVSFHVAEHGADADEELLWYDATELDEVSTYLAG